MANNKSDASSSGKDAKSADDAKAADGAKSAEEPSESTTTVGPTITIRGALKSGEDLIVKGRIDAAITSSKGLFIENSGVIRANMDVASARISGILLGDVTAEEKIEIASDGRMIGDMLAPRIVIHDGAAFRGTIDMPNFEGSGAKPGTSAGAAAPVSATSTTSSARVDTSRSSAEASGELRAAGGGSGSSAAAGYGSSASSASSASSTSSGASAADTASDSPYGRSSAGAATAASPRAGYPDAGGASARSGSGSGGSASSDSTSDDDSTRQLYRSGKPDERS